MSPDFLSRDLASLMREAAAVRDAAFGDRITFSKKVFIPLTHLCRDTCGYCTFVHPPRRGEAAYLTPEQVLEIARAGQAAGCAEALFTLGDKPELKWKPAAEALAAMGHATTLDYLAAMGALVFKETGLLPHFNPGLMDAADLASLRKSSVSMGIMLESTAERLGERGGAHYGAPDKVPALRLATLEAAGKAKVPFTSGILIGIGETREERIEALMALRDLHRAHGHLQEVIIQNFKAKPDTRMANAPEPSFDELLWTIAVARLIFGDTLSVQAPPNLQEPGYGRLIEAGIDDWGGVSPVTPDHVNPEAAVAAARRARRRKRALRQGADRAARGLSALHRRQGLDRSGAASARAGDELGERPARDNDWRPGLIMAMPAEDVATLAMPSVRPSASLAPILDRAVRGDDLGEGDIVRLFEARGPDFAAVAQAADALRKDMVGDTISYAVVRNINYTNICYFRCGFCAFSKGKLAANLRGSPYDLTTQEIVRRASRSLGPRRHRSLHAGRHPSRIHRPALPRCLPRRARGDPGHACPCLLAARGLARRHHARPLALRLPDPAARRGPRQPARHRGRSARRRGARHPLPRQGLDRPVARDHARRARRRPALDGDDHVRPCRPAGALGAPSAARPQSPEGHRRLHRAGAAAVRRRRSADRAQGPGAHGPDLPRVGADAFDRPAGAAPAHQEHPDLVGEDGHRGRPALPAGRRQRSRRHPDERDRSPAPPAPSTARSCRPTRWKA